MIYIYICMYSCFRYCQSISGTDISYQNLACGAHFQVKITAYLKILIGIKFCNTKQCRARLSPLPVELSSFTGSKFSPKKGESNL